MRTAMVVGNGLTISLLKHVGSTLDSSFPLRWGVSTPGRDSLLIDDLPGLKSYIQSHNSNGALSDFELIARLVENLPNAPVPTDLSNDDLRALLDTCHCLAVGYGWLQIQMNEFDISEWPWTRWVSENHPSLVAALSWNYDLTLERLLERSKTPYFYPGIPTRYEAADIDLSRPAILVAKPHGSTNFAHDRRLQISAGAAKDGPYEPLTYPRQIHVCTFDGPMEVLMSNELQTIRQVADLVLPGEWNRLGNYVQWVGKMTQEFASAVSKAEHLLIVGFQMAKSDRAEFLSAIASAKQLKRITIADPKPNEELIGVLQDKAPQLIHWPDGPYGRAVSL